MKYIILLIDSLLILFKLLKYESKVIKTIMIGVKAININIILKDKVNFSLDATLVMYANKTSIPPIIIIKSK